MAYGLGNGGKLVKDITTGRVYQTPKEALEHFHSTYGGSLNALRVAISRSLNHGKLVKQNKFQYVTSDGGAVQPAHNGTPHSRSYLPVMVKATGQRFPSVTALANHLNATAFKGKTKSVSGLRKTLMECIKHSREYCGVLYVLVEDAHHEPFNVLDEPIPTITFAKAKPDEKGLLRKMMFSRSVAGFLDLLNAAQEDYLFSAKER
jgi:hypothetical protein